MVRRCVLGSIAAAALIACGTSGGVETYGADGAQAPNPPNAPITGVVTGQGRQANVPANVQGNAPANPNPNPNPKANPPPPAPGPSGQVAQCPSAAAFAVCSDAQIVEIVSALNTAEIQENKLASKVLTSPDLQKLSKDILADHKRLDQSLQKDVISGAKLKGAPGALSHHLQMDAQHSLAEIRALAEVGLPYGQIAQPAYEGQSQPDQGQPKGPQASQPGGVDELSSFYIDHEVVDHIKTLGILETLLIPSAKNPALKSALQEADRVIRDHLNRIVDAQSKLEGACGGTLPSPANEPENVCDAGATPSP